MINFYSKSESETKEWAGDFAKKLKPGMIIALHGDLGSGKTILAQGFARGLGYSGIVNSPSYTLVNEYPGPLRIYHIDLYRLDENADWEEIGMDHYTSLQGICFVEWPERVSLPFDIWIDIRVINNTERQILVKEIAR